jgi:hypothetical protein
MKIIRKGKKEAQGERQWTDEEEDGRKAVADKTAPQRLAPASTTPSQAGVQGGQGRKA